MTWTKHYNALVSGPYVVVRGLPDDPADQNYRISYTGERGAYCVPGKWETIEAAQRAAKRHSDANDETEQTYVQA